MKKILLAGLGLVTALVLLANNFAVARDQSQNAKEMKLKITAGDKVLTATLLDNPTSRDFVSLLPLTLNLDDYAATEKISTLPKKLSTRNAPRGCDPSLGDITYYAPWGNLAIFYKDYGYSNGLVMLGRMDGEIEALKVPGSVKVTIELLNAVYLHGGNG